MDFMNLEKFLKLDKPEKYDFKLLMQEYYKKYEGKHQNDESYKELLERLPEIEAAEADPIQQWYLYKTLDVDCLLGKRSYLFDCDGSNGTCDLTTEIYMALWPEWIQANFGGDTMNSFATTFSQYGHRSVRTVYKERYCGDHKQSKELRKIFQKYAKYVSCLGNFVLVPKGFNGYRGLRSCKDYWDLSLDLLKYNKDEKNRLADQPDVTDVMGATLQAEALFRRYINTFFLWDYVTKDFEVAPLVPSHKEKMGIYAQYPYQNPYPEADEFKIFTNHVNARILRRGIFMVSMLRIATDSECKDDYASKIVPVLSTSAYLGSMEDVVRRLTAIPELNQATRYILKKIDLPDIPNIEE